MRCKDCKYREECKPKMDKFLGKHTDVLIAMGMHCCFPEERRKQMTCEGCKYFYEGSPCETLDDCCNSSKQEEADKEENKEEKGEQ